MVFTHHNDHHKRKDISGGHILNKSHKRQKAEGKLHNKFQSSQAAQHPAAPVAPVTPSNPHTPTCVVGAQQLPACLHAQCSANAWCSRPVSMHRLHWHTVSAVMDRCFQGGYSNVVDRHIEQSGLQVMLIENEQALKRGLRMLKDSMQDNHFGIDLEWRPNWGKGQKPTKVAMMQLASSTCVLLIRINRLGYRLPACLQQFLKGHTAVAFGWDSADDQKCQETFGCGKGALFGALCDVQELYAELGYGVQRGLKTVAKRLLGIELAKSKKVSCCNWAAEKLSPNELKYAALDALVTLHAFCELRQRHARADMCIGCKQVHGSSIPATYGGQQQAAPSQHEQHTGTATHSGTAARSHGGVAGHGNAAGSRIVAGCSHATGSAGVATARAHGLFSEAQDVMLGNVAGYGMGPPGAPGTLSLQLRCPVKSCDRVFEPQHVTAWRRHVCQSHDSHKEAFCQLCGRTKGGDQVWQMVHSKVNNAAKGNQGEKGITPQNGHKRAHGDVAQAGDVQPAKQARISQVVGVQEKHKPHKQGQTHKLHHKGKQKVLGKGVGYVQPIGTPAQRDVSRPGSSSSLASERDVFVI